MMARVPAGDAALTFSSSICVHIALLVAAAQIQSTMKFSAVLVASLAGTTYGFAPSIKAKRLSPLFMADTSAPRVTTPATNVDKSMFDCDFSNIFDPTEGVSPALTRNNHDEVWVQQVRLNKVFF